MNAKKLTISVLLLFVAASVIFLVYQETRRSAEVVDTQQTQVNKALAPDADVDIAYYFMTSARCPSCIKIEAFTKEAIDTQFASQIEDGTLVWKILEVDTPHNSHFINHYKLFTKSVVLSKIRNGKEVEWKNLDKVWSLLDDKDTFIAYVASEMNTFLESN